MPTTEDEKPRKSKTPRAPRAKKVAAVVAAAVADRASQPLLNDSLQNKTPSPNALEVAENTVSARVSKDVESAEALPSQPHGANLSSYAPETSVLHSLITNESVAPIASPESPPNQVANDLPHQLPTMQRPKISPLAPPNAASNGSLGKTTIPSSNSLPISLLNTTKESTDIDTPDAAAAPRDLRLSSGLTPANTANTANIGKAVAATAQNTSSSKPIVSTVSTNLPVTQPGVMLRQAREARGLTVADVANRLRMGNRQVLDLEAGHFENLPEGTFLRGFARNFSKVVGADTAAVLIALEAVNPDAAAPSTGIAPPAQNMQFSQHRPNPPRFNPRLGLLALVVAALSGATWYWFEHIRNGPTASGTPTTMPATTAPSNAVGTETPVSQALNPAALNEPSTKLADPVQEPDKAIGAASISATSIANPNTNTTIAAAKPTAADTTSVPKAGANYPMAVDRVIDKAATVSVTPAAAAPVAAIAPPPPIATAASAAMVPKTGNSTLSFTFTDTSWVEVADARGNLIVNRTFKKGETHQIEGRTPFSIVVGNSKNATMQYNGAPFDLAPHTKVSVARLRLK